MRPSLRETIARHGCPRVAVEIGVMGGYNAYAILSESAIELLVLVDPYEPYIGSDGKEITQAVQDENRALMLEKLGMFRDRIEFVQMSSLEASTFYPDGFFDYAYIDANHRYEFVKQDIDAWYPKVKWVLAGHDYTHLGVKQAVDEFSKNVLVLESDWMIEGEL